MLLFSVLYLDKQALVVAHSFENAKELLVELKDNYVLEESLYESTCIIKGKKLEISPKADFSANVFLLTKA